MPWWHARHQPRNTTAATRTHLDHGGTQLRLHNVLTIASMQRCRNVVCNAVSSCGVVVIKPCRRAGDANTNTNATAFRRFVRGKDHSKNSPRLVFDRHSQQRRCMDLPNTIQHTHTRTHSMYQVHIHHGGIHANNKNKNKNNNNNSPCRTQRAHPKSLRFSVM